MLRLFSLPDRESPGIRCQMTARSARPFEPKRGSFFFVRRWAYQEDQTESLPYRKRRRIAKLYPAAKPMPPGSVAGQAVILIRKPILYYPLFLLSSSLFGKELQISRILVGEFPTLRKNEKNERSKMGQSWAISDEKWGRLKVDNRAGVEMHKMRKKR